MQQRGRPTKLTPELQAKLIQAIEAGSYLVTACQLAGVSYKVFREWMLKGEQSKSGIYRDFRDAVEAAEARVEMRTIARWQTAMKNDWRGCAEFLSRRFPERWSATQRVQVLVQQQLEAEINSLFEAINNDPDIPIDMKQKIYQAAATIQDRVAVASDN